MSTLYTSIMKKKIWVFDSWRWGRYTLYEIKKILPEYDYLFFGDTAHMPYWDKTPEEIEQYTFAGLHWLFDHWCDLVVIACNTASAYTIRTWQQAYPHKKALSVTIPGIEVLIEKGLKSPLFLSTKATEQSGIIASLLYKYGHQGSLVIQSCSGLADIIEQESIQPLSSEQRKEIILDYVKDTKDYDSIVLACTHYGLWYKEFCELYPNLTIIDPSQECAIKLQDYLLRHPEKEANLSRGWTVNEHRT